MKAIIAMAILISFSSFAQLPGAEAKKEPIKLHEKMDDTDKEVFQRDVCRKPIEALETKYSNYTRAQLEKMKSECKY